MKIALFIVSVLCTNIVISQNSAAVADLKDSEIVYSTTASLLDNTAAVVISNPNSKDFNVNTENLSNISFDFGLNRQKLTGLEYFGLGNKVEDFKQVTIDKLLQPSISVLVAKSDTATYVAMGMSVTIVTIFRANKSAITGAYAKMRNQTAGLVEVADKIMARNYPTLNRFTTTEAYNLQRIKVLDSIPTDEADDFAEILKRPLLTLDFAAAYSLLYPDQTFSHNQLDRTGIWSTITYSPKLSRKNKYLNLFGFIRFLQDKAVYSAVDLDYTNQFEYLDLGGKVQIDVDDFSVGYEYISRNGDGRNYRSVGTIQYKINNNVYLTGGFGKNFTSTSDKNLISILGIKWGMNLEESKNWLAK